MANPIIEVKESQNCAICLEGIQPYELTTQLACHHLFHQQCLNSWLEHQKTCPLDRLEVKVIKSNCLESELRAHGQALTQRTSLVAGGQSISRAQNQFERELLEAQQDFFSNRLKSN